MRRELRLFFTALSFYSRLAAPSYVHQDHSVYLPDSIRYLPVIGWLAGFIAAIVFIVTNYLFGNNLAVILSMAATILLTGAFHEDGFADVCDGFGGGWTKEKILAIMKDSRLGTYGVAGLVLLLGIKFTALQQLFNSLNKTSDLICIAGFYIIAHSLSRFAAVTIIFNYDYVRITESKSGGAVEKSRSVNLLLAGIFALLPLAGLMIYTSRPLLGLITVPVFLLSFYLGGYFKKWIGGYTGDCLGAVQQLTEIVIYLSYLLIWKFT